MWFSVFCIFLLCSLVEVHSQAAPYVSFMGTALPNHAFIDLSLVGDSGAGGHSLQCHTDLSSCCSSSNGAHRGDWYFPADNILPLSGNIYETRNDMHVDLNRRNSAAGPSGIYRCDIPTDSFHDDSDITVRDSVFVGLYYGSGGNIVISGGMTLTEVSELNGTDPQFNLTCISTGGPATNATWTRDSIIVTEGTVTVLDDPVTAQYTHTLTGSLGGLYRCTVANDKPSADSAQYDIQGLPSPTSLFFSWTLSAGLTAYSYTLTYYNSYCPNDTYDVLTGIPGNETMYRLTGLQEGTAYDITLQAFLTDGRIASGSLTASTMPIAPSAAPTPVVASKVTTSNITVQWGVVPCIEQNGIITGYLVLYNNESLNVTGNYNTTTVISYLTPSTTYNIQVAAVNDAGVGVFSRGVIVMTPVEVPVVTVRGIGATSVSLAWTSAGSEVDSYEVMWVRDTSVGCSYNDEGSTTITDGSTSYRVGGLEEYSMYIITVTASNSAGSSEVSNAVTAMTLQSAPTASPAYVSVTKVNSSSITLQWGTVDCIHHNGIVTGYLVLYNNETLNVTGKYNTTTVISYLTPSTTYNIQVAAANDAGVGIFSSGIFVMTLVEVPVMTVGGIGATSVYLAWTSAGSEVDSYEVMWVRDTSVGCSYNDEGSTTITDGSTSYRVGGLEEDSMYIITVMASNSAGSSEDSNAVTAMTLQSTPTAAPAYVSVSEVHSSSITLQWGAVACIHRNGNITGYSVLLNWDGDEVSVVPFANVEQATITGLSLSTVYSVFVAAVNYAGTGIYSDVIIQETDGPFSSVSIESVSTTSLTLLMMLATGVTAVDYTISYSNTDCPSDLYEDITDITVTMFTLTGLQEGTDYSITVTASLSNGGTGAETIMATTYTTVPSAPPTSVSVSQVTSSSITVQWGDVKCIHRNGDITGYTVRYGSGNAQTLYVSGGSSRGATILSLTSSTNYTAEVAAVNNAGTGAYSVTIMVETTPSVYLSLNNEIIRNRYHSYVLMDDIGSRNDTALLCFTNHPESIDGHSGGDWVAPDGTIVGDTSANDAVHGFRVNRGPMVVRLLKHTASGAPPDGIYHCLVQDAENTVQEVFIGLYHEERGDITILSGMTLIVDSDLNGASPQFTFTCISTGGPATTVTWTRDSILVTEGTETVLDDPVTARYTHALTVSGREGGLYRCTVANEKPSSDTAEYNMWVPELFEAVAGQRQVVFSWSPQPVDTTTGYTLSCTPPLSSLPILMPQQGPLTVEGFSPNTFYSCSMTANDRLPAYTTITTQEDYSFFQIRLGEVANCTELKSLEEQMLEGITHVITEQLAESCTACGDTSNIIDMQTFVCYSESPTFVTYRARLEGTSETDSHSIISVIEEWVRGGPSFSVKGVSMTVDSECSVAISSLSDHECMKDSTATSQPQVLSGIIGGVIAAVVIVVVMVVVIAATVVVKVRRNRVTITSNKTIDQATDVYPRYSAKECVLTTTDNMAYEMVGRPVAVDDPSTHVYETIASVMKAKPHPPAPQPKAKPHPLGSQPKAKPRPLAPQPKPCPLAPQPKATYVNVARGPRPTVATPTAGNLKEGVKNHSYCNIQIMD